MSLLHPDKHYALQKIGGGFRGQAGPPSRPAATSTFAGGAGGGGAPIQAAPRQPISTTPLNHQVGSSETPPATPRAPVAPFLTGQQMAEYAQAQGQSQSQIDKTNADLSNLRVNTAYQQAEGTKQAAQQYDTANNQLAERGLFQSSIRAGDLADITATAASRNQYLQDILNTATLNAQTTINTINNQWGAYLQGINRMMVENAQAITPAMPT